MQADSVAGAKMLTNHLLSIGHRRISVIIEPDNVSTARERLQGYYGAMQAAGVEVSPALVVRTTADRAGGYGAMQQILGLELAAHRRVCREQPHGPRGHAGHPRKRGLVVPNDIALVCFDDVEHLAVLSPFLTVVNQPTEMFGTLGAQLLLDRITGDATSPSRRVVLHADLLVRESCGAKLAATSATTTTPTMFASTSTLESVAPLGAPAPARENNHKNDHKHRTS